MDYAVIIITLLVGAKGFWDFVQAVVNRTGRKAEIARQEATVEIDREKAKSFGQVID